MSQGAKLTVAELMSTPPLVVREQASAREAQTTMRDNDVRHLMVVDHEGRLVGILSDRDVLPSHGEGQVSSLMTEDVLFVRPQTRAVEASALMLDKKIGALPVVDEEERPIGVVTETDFLRACHMLLGGDHMG